MRALIAVCAAWGVAAAAWAGPVTLDSLLKEMVDREAIARFPEPAYTCRQFSSYDRASTTPEDPKTWFANGDANQYLRVQEVKGAEGTLRKEWVMADMDGPGAIVRFWSANPKGTVRVYLDGAAAPVIEAKMTDLLGGKWSGIGAPLSQEVSKGWNLYLPIPYAKHCKVTSDQDGFYYQINYRTYEAGTEVQSLTSGALRGAAAAVDAANKELLRSEIDTRAAVARSTPLRIDAGATGEVPLPSGPYEVSLLRVSFGAAPDPQVLRSLVLAATFDGEETVWAPIGDFFGSGVGVNAYRTWWNQVGAPGDFMCLFPMPYEHGGTLRLINLGKTAVNVTVDTAIAQSGWDSRSMHFHATWHYQYPIHAYGGRGTMDWNYVEVTGKGVYVGDSLAVMNPAPEWWGEGDEKIYVDGEKFPSHFGTGTEDYYGYAWCWPEPFQHPFHAQPRADGHGHKNNNWGHTTVTRVRSLDAVPFTRSLRFDMEVWHWRECDEAYAATTYFYAAPGATTNRAPQPEEAAKPIPQPPPLPPPPPPFKIAGAIECEGMKVLGTSEGLVVQPQEMDGFGRGTWSGDAQLWVQGRKVGDYVELEVPAGAGPEGRKPMNFVLYATRSWDYGKVGFSINGQAPDEAENLYSGGHKVAATGPIHLGVFRPRDGKFVLRAQVTGSDEHAEKPGTFFGLDCVVLTPATEEEMRGAPGMMHDEHGGK